MRPKRAALSIPKGFHLALTLAAVLCAPSARAEPDGLADERLPRFETPDSEGEVDRVAGPRVEASAELTGSPLLRTPRTQVGALLDAGLPDGANVALAWRPFYWLRTFAGPSHNLNGFGLRGGVTLIPVDGWISPSLTFEAGHFFPGDLSASMESVLGVDDANVPERLSYSYGNAHLGVELGTPEFVFYLRGGYSVVDAHLTPAEGEPGTEFRFDDDVHLTVFAPSAKLGFAIFFL